MTYSVNWNTKVVTIPKADTVFVSNPPDVRSLDVTTLWTNLIDIQDGEEGISYLDIVRNTPPLTVAGVTLARVIEIINGYTITFENGAWAVNIVGGNSNLADVVNKNSVSVNTGNSAGFIQGSGSGLTAAQATTLELIRKIQTNRLEIAAGATANWKLYDDDNALLLTWDVKDASGNAITIPAGSPSRRTKGV